MKQKIIYSLIALVLALFIGGELGSYNVISSKLDRLQKDLNKITSTNTNSSDKVENPNSLKSPEYGSLVKVTKVIDGDTIELEGGERLRYIGIDTPEKSDPRKPVQCFAQQASEQNKKLVEGKLIKFYKDVNERDKYQRLLGYVYLEDGTFINLKLVETGYAFSYPYSPDISKQEEFNKAQIQARNNKIGLWNDCIISEPSKNRYQTNAVNN